MEGGFFFGFVFSSLRKAGERASELAELLPQGMNLHTHFDPFYDFFICVSHILFAAPLSKRCFKLDGAWKRLWPWLPPPLPRLPPRPRIGLVARALPNMKLAPAKRRINKRPGILFVIFNPSHFPNSLLQKCCSSVYIILIEGYIRACKCPRWM